MIISDSHRFIFVHIPKAAGSSISAALKESATRKPWARKAGTKHETMAEFFERTGAMESGPEGQEIPDYRSYFKFAFVRNPWERMASLYCYLHQTKYEGEIRALGSFSKFVEAAASHAVPWIEGLHSIRPQSDFVTAQDGSPLVDAIGCHETLASDFQKICLKLGITAELPHRNRSEQPPCDVEYDEAARAAVGRLYAADIERFGYAPGQAAPVRRLLPPV
jgi:hypothetical protein